MRASAGRTWRPSAARGAAGWLSPYVPAMFGAALGGQLAPSDAAATEPDVSGYGLLPQAEVFAIVHAVAADVLFPGLERFGVDTTEARAALPRSTARSAGREPTTYP